MAQKSAIVKARHDQFVEHLTDPKSPTFLNQTESYRKVYPDANGTAPARSSDLMKQSDVQQQFLAKMEKYGLTDDVAARKHSELWNDGDKNIVYKGLRMYHELKGRLGPRYQSSSDPAPVQIVVNISPPVTPKHVDIEASTTNDAQSQA